MQKGFTLVELMITVVIIGVLASIAVPAYSDYVLRGKLTEAMTELATLRVKLEQNYQDTRDYAGNGFNCANVTNTKYFTYRCTVQSTTAFTAEATGIAAQGTGGFVYTINQSNAKATTGVPAGWTTSATCWITKKGGVC